MSYTPYLNRLRNRIINGAMVIDQRAAGASSSIETTAVFSCDRWSTACNINGKASIQQNAGSITPPQGFTHYIGITSSSAYSVAAGDVITLRQNIEGFLLGDMGFGAANASSFTISFWVRSSLTGTFGGSAKNGGSTRSYPFTYTINSANTWEKKVITIPGDTTGTWATDNTGGLIVSFGIGVGTTTSGTAGAWAATNYNSATGAVSVVGTNGATLYLTGVQLEKGDIASEFEWRDFGQELILCQRYFEKSANMSRAILTASESSALITTAATSIANNAYYFTVYYKVRKRGTPTVTAYPFTTPSNTGRLSNDTGTDYAASSATVSSSESLFVIRNQSGGALTVGAQQLILGGWYSDADLL